MHNSEVIFLSEEKGRVRMRSLLISKSLKRGCF
jgi:hypothetical protein